MVTISRWPILVALASLLQSGYADLELLRPGNNVSSRPIIEFRARKTSIREGEFTHAFVAVGRRLDNGLIYFDGIAGFYPSEGDKKLVALRNVLGSPGSTKYKLPDLRTDETFLVDISERQYQLARFTMANWEHRQTYDLLQNNCVDMLRNLAQVLGLEVGTEATPIGMVSSLRRLNTHDRALRSEKLEEERQEAARILNTEMDAAVAGKLKDLERRRLEYERKVRAIDAMRRSIGQHVPLEQSTGAGKSTPAPGKGSSAPAPPKGPPPPTSPPVRPKVCSPATCPQIYVRPPSL